jgi:hypothetical protein
MITGAQHPVFLNRERGKEFYFELSCAARKSSSARSA